MIAVATRARTDANPLDLADKRDLELAGFVTFLDLPKADVAASLERLRDRAIRVKVITGVNAAAARHLCEQVGLPVAGQLTGAEIAARDDDALALALAG